MVFPNMAINWVMIELRKNFGTDADPIGTHEMRAFWSSLTRDEKKEYIISVTQSHPIIRDAAMQAVFDGG